MSRTRGQAFLPGRAKKQALWECHESGDDLGQAEQARFSNSSATAIYFRLPPELFERIAVAMMRRAVPGQSPIKVWLAKRVDAE